MDKAAEREERVRVATVHLGVKRQATVADAGRPDVNRHQVVVLRRDTVLEGHPGDHKVEPRPNHLPPREPEVALVLGDAHVEVGEVGAVEDDAWSSVSEKRTRIEKANLKSLFTGGICYQ